MGRAAGSGVRRVDQRVSAWEVAWGTPHRALRPGVVRYNGFRLDLPRPRWRLELPVAAAALVIVFDGTCASAAARAVRPRWRRTRRCCAARPRGRTWASTTASSTASTWFWHPGPHDVDLAAPFTIR
jgi:hypothetical protein